jgi:hypothetical protein
LNIKVYTIGSPTNETGVKTMKAQNKAGTWFALEELSNGNALVHKLCSSYCGQVRGGIQKMWRIVQPSVRMSHKEFQKMAIEGMPKSEAEKLFNRRLKGTQK